MKLKKLLKDVPLEVYKGNKEVDITGLTLHSKKIFPGNLFIARKGFADDGTKYIDEAIASGAIAILSDMGNPFLKEVVQLIHPDVRAVEGKLASVFYQHPSKELFMVGITGTNGKTSIAYLLKSLFDSLSIKTGLLSTIEYIRGDKRTPADRTTCDVISNHKFLREMVSEGCSAAVMEVTSHALDQGRVNEIGFDVAIYTNLSRDHIDEYHMTMENYAAAKAKLFTSLEKDKVAIINSECPWHTQMIEKCSAQIITYGFSEKATIYASDIQQREGKTSFVVHYLDEEVTFETTLIGRHNVLNLLAVIATALQKKFSLASLVPHIRSLAPVRGRLERVGKSNVFVDYSHTPDALEKVLIALKELNGKNIITCFGCGGNRDRTKRPEMAKVAEKYSSISIVTSDNPRKEEPTAILQDIVAGFTTNNYLVEIDRALAIEKAIALAKKEDIVLIAGKGHETVQIFANLTVAFDDREVALSCLKRNSLE